MLRALFVKLAADVCLVCVKYVRVRTALIINTLSSCEFGF